VMRMSDYECKRCGAFIKQNQIGFCNKCRENNSVDIKLIKTLISETNFNDLTTVSTKTGISIKTINMLARNNYLEFTSDK